MSSRAIFFFFVLSSPIAWTAARLLTRLGANMGKGRLGGPGTMSSPIRSGSRFHHFLRSRTFQGVRFPESQKSICYSPHLSPSCTSSGSGPDPGSGSGPGPFPPSCIFHFFHFPFVLHFLFLLVLRIWRAPASLWVPHPSPVLLSARSARTRNPAPRTPPHPSPWPTAAPGLRRRGRYRLGSGKPSAAATALSMRDSSRRRFFIVRGGLPSQMGVVRRACVFLHPLPG